MGGLLQGNAPLRGRAGLELIIHTLNFQLAGQFWNFTDPLLALKVHAIVGGTPAYRREFIRDDTPTDLADFDNWVARTVLNPRNPLFREARYLLAEELGPHDAGLYHSVLAAITDGNATRNNIASYLGRKAGDLAHPLTVLEDAGLITRELDAFRGNRTTFHIAEPLVTFYHAIMRPNWAELEHSNNTTRIWKRQRQRFTSKVLGPHFEQLCRYWTFHLSPEDLFQGYPNRVASSVINDPAKKTSHEIDVVVFGLDQENRTPLLGIGEVKWGEKMGMSHVNRLRHIRGLLISQGRYMANTSKLLCYSAAGFSEELHREAQQSSDIVLIGPADLYRSSDDR